jgi:hypothetical protein
MNTGQSLMTLIAMMLLTMVTTRVNTSVLNVTNTSQNSKYALAAISLAQSKIETASNQSYDEKTVGAVVNTTSALTAVASLGKDTGESTEASFDDFDDYNNFSYTDSTLTSAVYKISCTVKYVNPTSGTALCGITAATSQTWSKCLTVTVTSDYMVDTIRMSVINSYWKFR